MLSDPQTLRGGPPGPDGARPGALAQWKAPDGLLGLTLDRTTGVELGIEPAAIDQDRSVDDDVIHAAAQASRLLVGRVGADARGIEHDEIGVGPDLDPTLGLHR